MKIYAFIVRFLCLVFGLSSAIFAVDDYRILIDIPSYNNKEWYAKNLDSVLNQVGHTNYLAVITDDCSPDGTGDLIEKYIKEKHAEKHVMLIKNPKRRGALANHYHVIQISEPDDIILQLDGDDFFKSTNVFTYINELYKNKDLWWTYGVYENWPDASMECFSRKLLPSDGVTRKTIPFIFGPIRSYRAWFAKKIKLEDLIADFEPCLGKFYASAGDFALMYPLVEMARVKHMHYIDTVLYTRNIATPINDFKVNKNLQEKCARAIRDAQPYGPIAWQEKPTANAQTVTVALFDNQKDSYKLKQCLASIKTWLKGFEKLVIFYDSRQLACPAEYQACISRYPEYVWVDCAQGDAHALIRDSLRLSWAYYVFMIDSSFMINKQTIDLKEYAKLMNSTKAYTATFFDNGANASPHELLQDDVYVWKFKLANPSLVKPHALNGSLYNYVDAIDAVKRLHSGSLAECMMEWGQGQPDPKKVGLYLYPARVVHA